MSDEAIILLVLLIISAGMITLGVLAAVTWVAVIGCILLGISILMSLFMLL